MGSNPIGSAINGRFEPLRTPPGKFQVSIGGVYGVVLRSRRAGFHGIYSRCRNRRPYLHPGVSQRSLSLLVIPAAAVMFALWLIGEARRDAKVKRDREAAVARRQCQPRAVAPAAARPVAPGGAAPSILDPWLESKLAEMRGDLNSSAT